MANKQELEEENAKLVEENNDLKRQLERIRPGEGAASIVAPLKRTNRYVARRLDLHLPLKPAQMLRDLQDGLYEKGVKLRDGKEVNSAQRAVLWLLENLDKPSEAKI